MREKNIDLSERTPREVQPDELQSCDLVITMGCSAGNVCPADYTGESRDWDLSDPDDKDLEAVREIRDTIKERVSDLFDEIATD
jgi:protein-tyrosine-phosphatase